MTAPSKECIEILLAASIVGSPTQSWPAFVGGLQSTPDAQVSVVDTPGQTPNPKYLVDFPTIQVMVRGAPNGYEDAWAKGLAIKDKLLGMDPYNHSTSRWDGVTGLGDLMLRNDENSRPLIAVNFRIIREPSSAPGSARESL